MAQPYIGEIRMFAGNFAPSGWLFCNGQLLPISAYDTLFTLIGTTYGGDGQSTFALPNLQGRLPMHAGNGRVLSETGGSETVTLTPNQMPNHTHGLIGSSAPGVANRPTGLVPAASPNVDLYAAGPATTALAAQSLAAAGGSQPHDNMQPYLALSFIISLFGIFPSPT